MRIALTLAAGLLALVAITAAFGHSEPVRFNPAPGQVLATAPQRVDGWFSQEMRRSSDETSLEVHPVMEGGMLGDPVSGDTVIDDADRHHMSAELTGDLMPGQYVVSWSALSDEDEHADSGCFRFFVGQEAADAAAQSGARLDAAEECAGMGGHGMDEDAAEAGPTVTVSVPEEVEGPDVTVGLKAEGVEIRLPTNEGQDPAFAHYHLYLDIPPDLTHSHDGQHGGQRPTEPQQRHDRYGLAHVQGPRSRATTWSPPSSLTTTTRRSIRPSSAAPASPSPGRRDSDDGIDTGAAVGLAIGIGAAGLIVGGILGFALRRRAR